MNTTSHPTTSGANAATAGVESDTVRFFQGADSRSHRERVSARHAHAPLQRVSGQSALVRGRLVPLAEGESAHVAALRLAQPAHSEEGAALRAIMPHLSPRERGIYARHALPKMKAIATLARATSQTQGATAREVKALPLFFAHLSPREQKAFHAMQSKRRKAVVRATIGNVRLSRAEIGKALRGLPRDVRTSRPVQWIRARARLARALRADRNATRQGGRVAGQRARFHEIGAIAIHDKASGARIGRKMARTLGATLDVSAEGAFAVETREGTGRAVEAQGIAEMTLAARAALLSGQGWKGASKAATQELHRALREPCYADFESAARAQDRAWKRAQASFDAESGEESGDASEAQTLLMSLPESVIEHANDCYQKALRGMRAVVAYWSQSRSNYARAAVRKDITSIREHAMREYGMMPQTSLRTVDRSNDTQANTEYMAAYRLGARVTEGREILAKREREARERAQWVSAEHRRAQYAARKASAEIITLPVGRLENAAHDEAQGLLPVLSRILAKHHAAHGHGSARRTAQHAHRETLKADSRKRTMRAHRAPLPVEAVAALDALTA